MLVKKAGVPKEGEKGKCESYAKRNKKESRKSVEMIYCRRSKIVLTRQFRRFENTSRVCAENQTVKSGSTAEFQGSMAHRTAQND